MHFFHMQTWSSIPNSPLLHMALLPPLEELLFSLLLHIDGDPWWTVGTNRSPFLILNDIQGIGISSVGCFMSSWSLVDWSTMTMFDFIISVVYLTNEIGMGALLMWWKYLWTALSFLCWRQFWEWTIHVQFYFKDPVTTSFDTATSNDGIAAATKDMLLGILAFEIYPIPLDLGVLIIDGIFPSVFHHPWISVPFCLMEWIYVKLIATHWSNREVDPNATTVIIAEFCLIAPCDKTGHNVINNKACQWLNSEQISTA